MVTRKTNQNKLIEKEVQKLHSFFDAATLFQLLSKRNEKIGIATVYRFLNRLSKAGNIHSFLCGGRKIYSTSRRNHCHFSCEKCGEVKHIELNKIDFINEDLKGSVCHVQIDVSGVCETCS
jgi:Fur family ferric uptake transcriptional regulator